MPTWPIYRVDVNVVCCWHVPCSHQPDVLLLDEPTNHLDVESIEWLEKFLLDQNNLTLLFISHDRAFVDSIATRIVELDRGVLRSYEGNYSRYLDLKAQQLEAEENKMRCLIKNWPKKKHGFVKALKHVVPATKDVCVP